MTEHGVNAEQAEQVYDPSTPNRFAALQSGTVAAAVLSQPFDWVAAEKGFHNIFNLADYARDFGFSAFVARKDWLEKNGDTARGYLRAVSKAIDFLYNAADREEAVRILQMQTRMDAVNASRLYDYYTKELRPFDRSLDLPERQMTLLIGVLKEMGDFRGAEQSSRFVNADFLPH